MIESLLFYVQAFRAIIKNVEIRRRKILWEQLLYQQF